MIFANPVTRNAHRRPFRRYTIHVTQKTRPKPDFLFGLLMRFVHFALTAKLLQFETLFDGLLVLERMITNRLTVSTFQLDEIIL